MHKSVVCLLSRAFLPLFILGPPSGQMLSHHLGWDPRQQDFGIGKLWSLLSTPRNPGYTVNQEC